MQLEDKATIHALPPELVATVLEHLSRTPSHDYREHPERDITNAVSVCRTWREPAQRALFASILLSADRVPAWLASSARSQRRIHHLSLRGGFSEALLSGILAECPGLISLEEETGDVEGESGVYHCCMNRGASGQYFQSCLA